MESSPLVQSIFLIFCGAAVFSTIALYTRQSMIVAYMILGALIGPWGLRWINDSDFIRQAGDIGILFLLFLLGLDLQPRSLLHLLKKASVITLLSASIFTFVGFIVAYVLGFSMAESIVIGAAMMFSSTIIGLKLLPTTVLHHQHTGELMISILLLQDILAIIALLLLNSASNGGFQWTDTAILLLALPCLITVAYVTEHWLLSPLIRRFNKIREYVFLVAIAWCLCLGELANMMHLSPDIGAFIAGVAMAQSPISSFITESLKPLRDFFLILFFFSIGAYFNSHFLPQIFWESLILALVVLILKPVVFAYLLRSWKEESALAWEVGFRLGQASEFSILVAYLASSSVLIGDQASAVIQLTSILTFVVTTYLVVLRYPTPIAISDKLRRD